MIEIIAECGLNHGGDLWRAVELARMAKWAGAAAAKFQTFIADKVLRRDDPDFDRIRRVTLSFRETLRLAEACAEMGIEFMSTPGDLESLRFLVDECRVRRIKVGSDDLTNRALLLHAFGTGLPLIISTGMATLGEVDEALSVAYDATTRFGRASADLTLLHCTSLYPCPARDVNLLAMGPLRNGIKAVGAMKVGFSDHTVGPTAALAAAALGACMIEKHLRLFLDDNAIDAAVSTNPDLFRAMVDEVRRVEEMLGDGCKAPGVTERAQIPKLRKGRDGLRGMQC